MNETRLVDAAGDQIYGPNPYKARARIHGFIALMVFCLRCL